MPTCLYRRLLQIPIDIIYYLVIKYENLTWQCKLNTKPEFSGYFLENNYVMKFK